MPRPTHVFSLSLPRIFQKLRDAPGDNTPPTSLNVFFKITVLNSSGGLKPRLPKPRNFLLKKIYGKYIFFYIIHIIFHIPYYSVIALV